jgi:hypothetical protein
MEVTSTSQTNNDNKGSFAKLSSAVAAFALYPRPEVSDQHHVYLAKPPTNGHKALITGDGSNRPTGDKSKPNQSSFRLREAASAMNPK